MDIEPNIRRSRPPGRVLVVGAGPVGLVSALLLRHHDVDVDVIDRTPEAVSQSRATDLHPATLERLDPYGVTADLLDIGQVVRAAVVHCGGRVAGRIPMGRRGSPFPFALTVPQCTTEGLLQDHLSRLGCKVERGVELVSLEPHSNGAIATVTVGGDPTSMLNQREYDWVLGCDGASSVVRRALQVRFVGATSSDVCAIADVELELPFPRDEIHLMLRHGGGVHVLPMPIDGYVRLLVDRWPGALGVDPDPDALVDLAVTRLGLDGRRASGVRWTSSFVMHRRAVTRMRDGRVLLAGDAAHVCAPIGGQGLNSGVGDAVAIVPALVSVLRGHAPDSLLGHVARQRQRAAQRTGRLAWLAASVNSPRSRRVASARDALAPAGVVASRRFVTAWLAGAADR